MAASCLISQSHQCASCLHGFCLLTKESGQAGPNPRQALQQVACRHQPWRQFSSQPFLRMLRGNDTDLGPCLGLIQEEERRVFSRSSHSLSRSFPHLSWKSCAWNALSCQVDGRTYKDVAQSCQTDLLGCQKQYQWPACSLHWLCVVRSLLGSQTVDVQGLVQPVAHRHHRKRADWCAHAMFASGLANVNLR